MRPGEFFSAEHAWTGGFARRATSKDHKGTREVAYILAGDECLLVSSLFSPSVFVQGKGK